MSELTILWPEGSPIPEVSQIWVDYETDSNDFKTGHILEAGIIYTDRDLNVIAEREATLPLSAVSKARIADVEFVFNMHTESGLLARLHDPAVPKVSVSELEQLILGDLKRFGHTKKLRFCGSGSTGFDYYFTQRLMPTLGAFSPVFYQEDVRYVRNAYRQATGGKEVPGEYHQAKTHRAIEDIRLHLAEYKAYGEVMLAGAKALNLV
jgi:oligoribonuclease (3'-5' exoribonuclease)